MQFPEMPSSCQAKKIEGNGQEEGLESKNLVAKNSQEVTDSKAGESLIMAYGLFIQRAETECNTSEKQRPKPNLICIRYSNICIGCSNIC